LYCRTHEHHYSRNEKADENDERNLYPVASCHLYVVWFTLRAQCAWRPISSWLISKVAVFWVVATCSLVEVYRSFRCACSLHQSDRTSERRQTSTGLHGVTTQKTVSHLPTRRCENLKSH
jgi:hypothetical protein